MIDCRDVHQAVASGEVEGFGLLKRLELKLHLMMCRHCRNYTVQIEAMGTAIRRLVRPRTGDEELCARLELEVLKSDTDSR